METKGHNLEANMVSLEEKFVEDVNEKQPRDVVEMRMQYEQRRFF